MYGNKQRKKNLKDATLLTTAIFFHFKMIGKNQYHDLGSTITTFLSHTLLLNVITISNCNNVYSKL